MYDAGTMPPRKKKPKPIAPSYTPAQIRALRKRLGLEIAEAAEKIGVTARLWMAWELPSQKRSPSTSHALLVKLLSEGKI